MRRLTSVGCVVLAVYQIFWCLLAAGNSFAANVSPPPVVVVSIQPIHHLVEAVMEGVARPVLLLSPQITPHHYALKPSERKLLEQATLFFWVGPALEHFLLRTVESLARNKGAGQIVQLDKTPGLQLLPSQENKSPERQEQDKDKDKHHLKEDAFSYDPHIWLDPARAVVLAHAITRYLSLCDPSHQTQYRENETRLIKQLNRLDEQLKKKTVPLKGKPYFVFHDGYRYFEQRYGLNSLGALTAHPELPLSLERFQQIKKRVKQLSVRCLFKEAQFQPRWLEGLAKESHVRLGTLDPMGVGTRFGAAGYAELLYRMTDALEGCLLLGTED